jgi:transcriptional regulator with XRE-family HTH domain
MFDAKTIARFESKFEKAAGCWNWKSATVKGYGVLQLSSPRILVKAPRMSWLIYRGVIPEGLMVLHTCDNPLCVNPDHLFVGSAADNTRDARSKGRLRGNVNASGQKPGEAHPMAKLSLTKMLEVRRLAQRKEMSQQKIAKLYGISQQQVSKIVRGVRWVPDAENLEKVIEKLAAVEAQKDDTAETIKDMLSRGFTQREIAEHTGVSQQKVSAIKRGLIKRYKFL